jgi:hypothetical protein
MPKTTGQLPDDIIDKDVKVSSLKAPDKSGKTDQLPPDDKGTREPDKYDGKSAEELRQILGDQEKAMGKLSERMDNFKGDIDYWRTKAEAFERERQLYGQGSYMPRQTQYIEAQQPEIDPNAQFNWQKPVDMIDQRVEQRLQERDIHAQARQVSQVIDEAKVAFGNGFEAAVKSNPKLFEGQDFQRKVADFMYQYYAPYAQQGIPVAHYVNNPRTWIKTAQNLRLDAGEYDSIVPEQVNPISPTGTAVPDRGKMHGDEPETVNFEDGATHMIDYFKRKGYVKGEEEAADMVREEREERTKLEE